MAASLEKKFNKQIKEKEEEIYGDDGDVDPTGVN
jgi:hypothetical protein